MSLQKTRVFILKEKLVSIKDKGNIMNQKQEIIGFFEGKAIKIANTYRIRDVDDNALLTLHEKLASARSTYKFYKGGETNEDKLIGKLKKKIVSVLPKYWFENPEGNKLLSMKGNINALKYKILQNKNQIAEISKKLFKIKGTYGVKISDDVSDEIVLLILGIVISLHHEKEEN
jgi:uncharacterized protein YxjI